jgi:hypothetical protein
VQKERSLFRSDSIRPHDKKDRLKSREEHMTKLSVFAALLALFGGTAAMLHSDQPGMLPTTSPATLAGSAAFRDGLYLGQLTARRGGQMHIASGRWATISDRGLFVAGFQQGYRETLVAQTPAAQAHQAR